MAVYQIYRFPSSSLVSHVTFEHSRNNDGYNLATVFVRGYETPTLKGNRELERLAARLRNASGIHFRLSGRCGILPTDENVTNAITESSYREEFSSFKKKILAALEKEQFITGDPQIEDVDLMALAYKEIEKFTKHFKRADGKVELAALVTPFGGSIAGAFKYIARRATGHHWYLEELQKFVNGERDNFPNRPSPSSPKDFGR